MENKFEVIKENEKFYVLHKYKEKIVDKMIVYGVGKKPYVKRLSSKMYLEGYMIQQLNELKGA